MICMDCTVHLHKDHNYDMVDEIVFAQCKAEVSTGLESIRENIYRVKQALTKIDTSAKAIDDHRAMAEANTHSEIDGIISYLNQRRAELVNELSMLTQQKCKSLVTHKDAVKVTLAKHTSCLEYAERGLEMGTPAEVAVVMKGAGLERISESRSPLSLTQQPYYRKLVLYW